jgi:hypothetical protein
VREGGEGGGRDTGEGEGGGDRVGIVRAVTRDSRDAAAAWMAD